MDDLISRQAAIELFERELSKRYNTRERAIGFIGAKRILENVPTVQPERHAGKWISNDIDPEAWNFCSVCGESAIDLYDFCPNCGADMRGEEHGHECKNKM